MNLKIAVQMDPIKDIEPSGDSSFAIMLEAQQRGYEVNYYNPNSLALSDNILSANVAPIKLFDKQKGEHFRLGEFKRQEL
ncbi:MAG: glutathione synthase, partial [Devosiaceae bacterium]|nr:glutathione synthase [Devosiaceae bacterium]